jgi:predicted unusual protein kinase regulating ubiquinone biosynthesis (AarF/ABC1/UbiB family)
MNSHLSGTSVVFNWRIFQLLETGFFHADPHPGNLLVTQDGRLALIDFGLMADVPIQVRVLNYLLLVFASVFLKLSNYNRIMTYHIR